MIDLDARDIVPFVAFAGLVVWLAVAYRVRAQLRHTEKMPEAVREGSLVAVYAACIGGTLASLGFVSAIGPDVSTTLAIAWRMAVLVCGAYAFIGSAMDGHD